MADARAWQHEEGPDILDTREKTHGDFAKVSNIAFVLKSVVRDNVPESGLSYAQQEVLESIMLKIARILSGDPNFLDHWDDIIGYARLGKEAIEPQQEVEIMLAEVEARVAKVAGRKLPDFDQAELEARVGEVAQRFPPPCPDLDGDIWCVDPSICTKCYHPFDWCECKYGPTLFR